MLKLPEQIEINMLISCLLQNIAVAINKYSYILKK